MSELAERHGSHVSLDGLPVELLDWPADAARRDALAKAGVPRLLLVAADARPPAIIGVDEDWVRMPAAEADLLVRAAQLLRLERARAGDMPYIDANRIVHRAGATVVLTSIEARVMSLLLRNAGAVVSRRDLEDEVWNGAAPSGEAIDAAVYRLRRRLSGLSLAIRSARGRGFVLYVNAP